MVETRIIKTPSPGTVDILLRRMANVEAGKVEGFDAVGLVQGRMIDMVVAADIAEKAVGVTAVDIRGSCPQNMVLLAIFGDTASVEDAVAKINNRLEKRLC